MTDPKAYIEFGKLEEYILGHGSMDLIQEVECMARVFPEIKEEIISLQLSFEKIALAGQVIPPSTVKQNILKALQDESNTKTHSESQPHKTSTSLKSTQPSRTKWMPLLGLLLFSFLVLSYWFYSQNIKLNKVLNQNQLDLIQSKQRLDSLNQSLQSIQNEIEIIRHPSRVAIRMTGTKLYPEGVATIYWSSADHQVYVSSGSLPIPPAGHQFQLWAIVEGKPIDLGLLSKANTTSLQQMKSIDHPTTFAVTLEQEGGSPSPTLDQMYVAGNVAGLE